MRRSGATGATFLINGRSTSSPIVLETAVQTHRCHPFSEAAIHGPLVRVKFALKRTVCPVRSFRRILEVFFSGLQRRDALLRQKEILSDHGSEAERGRIQYDLWKSARDKVINRGQEPSVAVFRATDGMEPPLVYADRIQVQRVNRSKDRPQGARFGTLVHMVMRDVQFNADYPSIIPIAQTHARLLDATPDEVDAATHVVAAALQHDLFELARKASQCHRELPILMIDLECSRP
jgi:hypothetical protein